MEMNLNTTEGRREVFQITLDWLKAGGYAELNGVRIGFDMSEVVFTSADNDGDPVEDYDGNECGTVCCMLGHQRLVSPYGSDVYDATHKIGDVHVAALNELFYPDLFKSQGVRLTQVSPAMAAATLERYIETGEVEWRIEELT